MTIETDTVRQIREAYYRNQIRLLNATIHSMVDSERIINLNQPERWSPLPDALTDFFTINGERHTVKARVYQDKSGNHVTLSVSNTEDQIRQITLTTDAGFGYQRLEINATRVLNPTVSQSTHTKEFDAAEIIASFEHGTKEEQLQFARSLVAFMTVQIPLASLV